MQYIATFCEQRYRGVYGSKGDDGWDHRYTWESLKASSDEDALKKAQAREQPNYSLSRIFAVSHEVPVPQRAAVA